MSRELDGQDIAALELLEQVRKWREASFLDCALAARSKDDALETSSSNAGLLAQESLKLYELMRKRSQRFRVTNLLGRNSLKTEVVNYGALRDSGLEVIRTPLMFTQEDPAKIDNAEVVIGNIFETAISTNKIQPKPLSIRIFEKIMDYETGLAKEGLKYHIRLDDKDSSDIAMLEGPSINKHFAQIYPDFEYSDDEFSEKSNHMVRFEMLWEATMGEVHEHPAVEDINDELYFMPLGMIIRAQSELCGR